MANGEKIDSLGGEELTPVGYPAQEGEALHTGYVRNALALVSDSSHKEGAWAFVEYFLSRERRILETYYLEEEEIEEMLRVIEETDFSLKEEREDAVMEIIKEGAVLYFGGPKGIDETADIIQNKVSVLLGER